MDEELDIVSLEAEDGSELQLRVERYFYFNGEAGSTMEAAQFAP